MEEPPYKKNLERLAALQDRLSKVQKTAESLLATVSGSGGDYTDKLVYTDVTRVSKYLETNTIDDIEDDAREVISDNPWQAIIAALVVGLILGWLLKGND